MADEALRSRSARAAAEQALVSVVHHYGSLPEFVVLGGLVPEILCVGTEYHHAGTTDVDVQVDLEIAAGSVNTARLERALRNAEFEPQGARVWCWVAGGTTSKALIKFELLADDEAAPAESTIKFMDCEILGAVNLRGTGFAARDAVVRKLTARIGGDLLAVDVKVTGLAGFLLAKTAAARSRRLRKDWYDIAFVLRHNDAGGPSAAAQAVRELFGDELDGSVRTAIDDLLANFVRGAQGTESYVEQMLVDHPDLDPLQLTADAILSVQEFHRALYGP